MPTRYVQRSHKGECNNRMCAYGWGGRYCQQGMYNTRENVINNGMCTYGWDGSDCQQGMYNTRENAIMECVPVDGVEAIANRVCTTRERMQ